MSFPNDDTGQVLAEMHGEGIDFTIIHKVVFFQLFERKEDAQAMVDHLASKAPEMEVLLQPDQTPNVWDVDCVVNMLLDYDAIIAQEAEFEQLAEKFKGYNDGWGVEV